MPTIRESSDPEDLPVEGEDEGGGLLPLEGAASGEAPGPQLLGRLRLVEERLDPPGDRARIQGIHEDCGVPGGLFEGASLRADDRKSRRHRLGDGKAEALLEGGENEGAG